MPITKLTFSDYFNVSNLTDTDLQHISALCSLCHNRFADKGNNILLFLCLFPEFRKNSYTEDNVIDAFIEFYSLTEG